jgi:hypothetical protein
MSRITDTEVAKKFMYIHKSAKDRKIDFDLKLTDVRSLLTTKTCFYTGVKFDEGHDKPHSRTFDRVNNKLGYVTGNVVACTKEINQYKGNMEIEEIAKLQKTLTMLTEGIMQNTLNNYKKTIKKSPSKKKKDGC